MATETTTTDALTAALAAFAANIQGARPNTPNVQNAGMFPSSNSPYGSLDDQIKDSFMMSGTLPGGPTNPLGGNVAGRYQFGGHAPQFSGGGNGWQFGPGGLFSGGNNGTTPPGTGLLWRSPRTDPGATTTPAPGSRPGTEPGATNPTPTQPPNTPTGTGRPSPTGGPPPTQPGGSTTTPAPKSTTTTPAATQPTTTNPTPGVFNPPKLPTGVPGMPAANFATPANGTGGLTMAQIARIVDPRTSYTESLQLAGGNEQLLHQIVNSYGGAMGGGSQMGNADFQAAQAALNKPGAYGGQWIGEKSPEALAYMLANGQAVKGPDGRYYVPGTI